MHFRKDIQGLRAVAVILVLLFHAGVPFLAGGYVGVDVFFVISGYLITGHILDALQRTGTLDITEFYARRVRRILPVSVFVLVVSFVASQIWMPPLQAAGLVRDAIATALYVPNLFLATSGTNYLAEHAPSPFQHYWSLGVEEQFYLAWPVALYVLWRYAKGTVNRVAGATGILVGASLVACVWLTFRSQPWAFFSLPTRAWELGAGALVAIMSLKWQPGRHSTAGAWIGLALIIAPAFVYSASTTFPGYAAVIPVVGTAMVIWFGAQNSPKGPIVVLGTAPAQWVGLLSYSLYLWHWPLLVIPAAAYGFHISVWSGLALTLAAIPLSMWSYRYIEVPCRSGMSRLQGRRVLVAALGASAVSAFAFLATSYLHTLWTWDAGLIAAVTTELPAEPSRLVPKNMSPSLRAVAKDAPIIYANGCHANQTEIKVAACAFGSREAPVTYALFGDSHAAQWLPALDEYARVSNIRVVVYTKSFCPSSDVQTLSFSVRNVSCETWRKAALAHMQGIKPAVVIMSNYQRHEPIGKLGRVEEWNAGLKRTIAALPKGAKAVVIGDTPDFEVTPAVCLSAHLQNTRACARRHANAVDGVWREAERHTALAMGAAFVDMNAYLCSEICPTVLGNILVYRDRHHLTTVASQALAGRLGLALHEL